MSKKISERLLLTVSLAFFYLNDLLFLNNVSSLLFYATDYIFRTVILVSMILSLNDPKKDIVSMIRGTAKTREIVFWTIGLVITGVLIDQELWIVIYEVLPQVSWSISYPPISNNIHFWFDLTYGLLVVAIVEEYIFRKLIPEKLKSIKSKIILVFLSPKLH